MSTPFCPGYSAEPYATLVRDYPVAPTYTTDAFRTEWGPVFHRGRLDGTACVLGIGQDPAQHEVVARRILVGAAGKRVQGFFGKLGLTQSYVLINTFLYSVYGQSGGTAHIGDVAITNYRNRWIQAILSHNPIQAVVSFGGLADQAWSAWLTSPAAAGLPVMPYRHVPHPTYPISAGGNNPAKVATLTKQMLSNWNTAITALKPKVVIHDGPFGTPYGDIFTAAELPDIPQGDLPAGVPRWMATEDNWAARVGTSAPLKRRRIQVTVPTSVTI